jgi:hypothetical protein
MMQNIDFLFEGDSQHALLDASLFLEDNLPASIIPYLKEANIRVRNVTSPSCTFSIHSLSRDSKSAESKALILITFDLTVALLCGFGEIEKAAIILHEIGHTINPYYDKITEEDERLISELLLELNTRSNTSYTVSPLMAKTIMSEIYADYFAKCCIPRYIKNLSKALDSLHRYKLAIGLEYITEIRKIALDLPNLFCQEGSVLSTLVDEARRRNYSS